MADEANHEVANLMAGIHEKTQASTTTLDLHYLNLVEASCLLDTFLDKQIERLRNIRRPFQELFIITGRGAHSQNGLANIKIKTKSRLQERNLK
jgi:DNA-nicking Smr family endonuclease